MAGEPLRVLLIQSWVIRGAEVRAALRTAGFDPAIYRVDFEAALSAALPRMSHDVILFDPHLGIPRATVESLMRQHGIAIPVVELTPGQDLGRAVRAALVAVRN